MTFLVRQTEFLVRQKDRAVFFILYSSDVRFENIDLWKKIFIIACES
jgi:hypothetical protein